MFKCSTLNSKNKLKQTLGEYSDRLVVGKITYIKKTVALEEVACNGNIINNSLKKEIGQYIVLKESLRWNPWFILRATREKSFGGV